MNSLELRKAIIEATHEWIRDAGLDIQDIEPFVGREVMPLVKKHVDYVIGDHETKPMIPKTSENIGKFRRVAIRNNLREEQRNRAGAY